MWRTCFLFVVSLLATCLIHGLLPAKDAFLGLDPWIIAGLPEGSGTYAFAAFERFHAGAPARLGFRDMAGVACFPSFHTLAALVMAQLLWPLRRLRPLVVLWTGLVIVSTIPIGGHYVIDLVAAGLLYLGLAGLAAIIETGAMPARRRLRVAPA